MTHIIIRAITSQLGSVWETVIWNYASIAWISSFYSRASLNPFPHFCSATHSIPGNLDP